MLGCEDGCVVRYKDGCMLGWDDGMAVGQSDTDGDSLGWLFGAELLEAIATAEKWART